MSQDYFLVVETVEAGRSVLSAVPHKWVNGETLSWPLKQANVLQKNAGSSPMTSWTKLPCTVKRKYIPSFSEAEREAGELSGQSTNGSDFVPKRKRKSKTESITNHLITGKRFPTAPKLSTGQRPNRATKMPMATKVIEKVYYLPDMSNLVANSQGSAFGSPLTSPAHLLTSAVPSNIQQSDTDKIISEISEKVVEKVSEILLSSMEEMLAKTVASLEMKIDAAIRQSHREPQYREASTSSFQFSPVTTTDGIDALEENLNDELFAKQFFAHMKRKIGNSGDACHGQNIAYGLIDHFFNRKVMIDCSWTGESKGGIIKYPMKKCVNILDMFFKLVHSVNETFSQALLEDLFKRFTRNAKKRSESKGKRQSSIHRRSKAKKSQKDIPQISAITTNDRTPQTTGIKIAEVWSGPVNGLNVDSNSSYQIKSEVDALDVVTNLEHGKDKCKEEELEGDEAEIEEHEDYEHDNEEYESSQESESDL